MEGATLHKPFTPQILLERVQQALATTAAHQISAKEKR
jgi:FixJ family two-component response regulator